MQPAFQTFLLPGEVLAEKYRIEKILGRGGMGVVLQATNLQLQERFAIKVLSQESTTETKARLLMEARAAARLKSDHVVRVFDFGETEGGDPYIVMELLDGRSLANELRRRGPLPVSEAVHWVLQAIDALGEAHSMGVIHRDVKPANLFLEERPDGIARIKVLDFGVARLPTGERLTSTTHAIGSPAYMAPEQLENQTGVDCRTDIWGLGCTLYELLTGRTPYSGSSLMQLASSLSSGKYKPLESQRSDVSPELAAIINRCLKSNREARFRNTASLGQALRRLFPRNSIDCSTAAKTSLALSPTLNSVQPQALASDPTLNSLASTPALVTVVHAAPSRRTRRHWAWAAALLLFFWLFSRVDSGVRKNASQTSEVLQVDRNSTGHTSKGLHPASASFTETRPEKPSIEDEGNSGGSKPFARKSTEKPAGDSHTARRPPSRHQKAEPARSSAKQAPTKRRRENPIAKPAPSSFETIGPLPIDRKLPW